jgi:hypothetical protein
MLIPFGVLSAAAFAPVALSDYELIASEILTANQASITFGNLGDYSSTYKHLQVRITGRLTSNQSGGGGFSRLRFNGDSSTSYRAHNLYGDGSSVTSNASAAAGEIGLNRLPDSAATASAFGAIVIDILDAYSTSKNTTTRQMAGYANNTPYIWFSSGAYFKTDALTSIFLEPGVGGNYATGSRFSLYGIKG